MERTNKQRVGYELLNITTKYLELDKKTRSYGTDVTIHPSEIHIVSIIAKNPGIHIGGLADYLSITKGGVSEVIRKIVKKDLVYKEVSQTNLSKLCLFVTEKGMTAHKHHQKYHDILNSMIESQLKGVTEDKVDFLLEFLSGVEKSLNAFEDKIEN